jgi:uncharacterized membrane protein YczE
MAVDVAAPRRSVSTITRMGVFAVSVMLVGMGIGLMVEGDLGVSPNDVTNTGLAERTGITVGAAAWIVAGTTGAMAWILGRRATIATVLASVGVGAGIDVALDVLPSPDAIVARLGFMVLGLVVLWIAITGIVGTDLGIGPIELLMLAINDRGVKLHVARWAIEIGLLAVGVALGGAVGLGTAAFALCTGPVLAVTIPWATRVLGTDLTRPVEVAACGP